MRVLVAGATGAIGCPVIDCLIHDGHEVLGLTHSEEKSEVIASKGAKPVHFDVFDAKAVLTALNEIKPEVVIDMLTSLPENYTPYSMQQAAKEDARLRRDGGMNLQTAAEAVGVKRYIVQSSAFFYAPRNDLANDLAKEDSPFALHAPGRIADSARLYTEIEKRVLQSPKIEGVALRFGFFYGPGTWYNSEGSMGKQVLKRQFPMIGKGDGVWNFVHIQDAAKACSSAIYSSPGAYNIVNNKPSQLNEWLPAFARFLGAKSPPSISEEEGLNSFGQEAVYYATKLRGASNAKARLEFDFNPRTFEWLL